MAIMQKVLGELPREYKCGVHIHRFNFAGANPHNNFAPEAAPFPDGSFSSSHPKTVLPS